MGRVINPDSAGKIRTRLSKEIVLAIRELMRQTQADALSRDLAAFIAMALLEIHQTVDQSVLAWEKKGYWVKADRFRMEWEWSATQGNKMCVAILTDDWGTVAIAAAEIAQKLMKIQVSPRNRLGTPWLHAWQRFQKEGFDKQP
ncbi:MAG: hypothetical protein IT308_11590 [Anaerolineaceae bacterium]|nr:hypothetical protein [Anaerolineaceae bacterium]